MRTCTKCGTAKEADQFYHYANGKPQAQCKDCVKASVRRHRTERADYYREYDRLRAKRPDRVAARTAYAKANPRPRPEQDPLKRAARVAVGNAVRDGKLTPPNNCQVCAEPCKPHGHHDDYTKPLEVLWVCTPCHALIHAYWRAKKRTAA